MDKSRKCIECGKTFFGRSDKKFCTELCRNAHNNRYRSSTAGHVRNINNILNKNRRILEQYFPNGSNTANASKFKLLEKGFNFNYITSVVGSKKGTCFFCYEFGYQPMDEENLVLVKKAD
jgi:hypothetical protein